MDDGDEEMNSSCSPTGITPHLANGARLYLGESDSDDEGEGDSMFDRKRHVPGSQRSRLSPDLQDVLMSPAKTVKGGDGGRQVPAHAPVNLNDDDDPDSPCVTDENRDTGVAEYQDFCRRFAITPISKFIKSPREKELNLRHRGIGDRGAEALSIVIEKNKFIRSLIVDDNNIKKSGAKFLFESCSRARALECFDISNNKLLDVGPEINGFLSVPVCSVVDLRLSGCKLAHSLNLFVEALQGNKWLQILDLSNNELTDTHMEKICVSLSGNTSLVCLSVESNHLSSASVSPLCLTLDKNPYIREVCLSNNNLGDSGLETFFNFLSAASSSSLRSISLARVQATQRCCPAIAKAVRSPSLLIEKLVLSQNTFSSVGVLQLIGALYFETPLEILDLTNTGCGDGDLEELLTPAGNTSNVREIMTRFPALVNQPLRLESSVVPIKTVKKKESVPQTPKNAAVSVALKNTKPVPSKKK